MKKLTVLFIAGLTVASCGYHRKNEVYSPNASVRPTFSSLKANVFEPKCAQCHGIRGDEPNLLSYSGTLEGVKPGNAEKSDLYKEVISGKMPPDSPMLTDDEIFAIYQWIQNGANND